MFGHVKRPSSHRCMLPNVVSGLRIDSAPELHDFEIKLKTGMPLGVKLTFLNLEGGDRSDHHFPPSLLLRGLAEYLLLYWGPLYG